MPPSPVGYISRCEWTYCVRIMSATEQRINDLLFIRDGILIEMKRTGDMKRVWELYLLKRDVDRELLILTA